MGDVVSLLVKHSNNDGFKGSCQIHAETFWGSFTQLTALHIYYVMIVQAKS